MVRPFIYWKRRQSHKRRERSPSSLNFQRSLMGNFQWEKSLKSQSRGMLKWSNKKINNNLWTYLLGKVWGSVLIFLDKQDINTNLRNKLSHYSKSYLSIFASLTEFSRAQIAASFCILSSQSSTILSTSEFSISWKAFWISLLDNSLRLVKKNLLPQLELLPNFSFNEVYCEFRGVELWIIWRQR